MNIGIVTTWFERGAAYVSRQYMRALSGRHAVKIYVRGGEDRAQGDPNWDGPGITWGKASLLPTNCAIDIPDMIDWIRRNELDLVLFNEQQWWEPVVVCAELGIKTAAYVDYYTEETVPLFALYDCLICNTERHYSVFADHRNAFYVPWGTDTALFSPVSMDMVRRGGVTFFHSCGYSPKRKGTDLLLRAFEKLGRRDSALVIHTQVPLAEQLPEERARIGQLVQLGRLEIIERTVGAPGLYGLGDVSVSPSRLEGLGLPIAEALASGLPVITTDAPPMREFVNSGVGRLARVARQFARSDGYYWPQCVADPLHIADHMDHYCAMGASIRDAKQAARSYAEANLNWADRAQALCDIFAQITAWEHVDQPDICAKARYYDSVKGDLRLKIARKFPLSYGLAIRMGRVLRGARGVVH